MWDLSCEVDFKYGNSFCYMGKYITIIKNKNILYRKSLLFNLGNIINFIFN